MKFKNLSISLLFVMCLFITGCGENKVKEVATVNDFSVAAENKSFVVSDNTTLYGNVDYIISSTKAIYEDIEIEMVEYSDSESAEKAQENHIESFNLLRSTGAHEVKDKGSNYYHYSLVSNGRYMVSSRIDNTLIFCKVMLEDKETVEEILDELDY